MARMVINNERLASLIRTERQRRLLSQETVVNHGGPYRMRQTEIERGDPVELSNAVLDQLDRVYRFAPGTAELAAGGPIAAPELIFEPQSGSAEDLGLNLAGVRIAAPQLLHTDISLLEIAAIAGGWDGPILIDAALAADPHSPLRLADWVDRAVWRTGCDCPPTVTAAIIDPLPAIHSFRAAVDLVESLHAARSQVGPKAVISSQRSARVGYTLLFAAFLAIAEADADGLTVLSELIENPLSSPHLEQWLSFHAQTAMSCQFAVPDFESLAELLPGLLAARDIHTEVWVHRVDGDIVISHELPQTPRLIRPGGNPSPVYYYRPDLTPELPVLWDWAHRTSSFGQPLVITEGTPPTLADSTTIGVWENNTLTPVVDPDGATKLTRINPDDAIPTLIPPTGPAMPIVLNRPH